MKLTTTCVPCLLRRVAYEVELCAPGRSMKALRECSKIVGLRASDEISSAEFASEVHQCAYEVIGEDDPYFELKKKSNEVALGLFQEAERIVESSKNPMRTAMILSIIGNRLDFGIAGSLISPDLLKREFRNLLKEPLGWDDSAKIAKMLGKSDEVIFLADNCGEIVFDKIFLKKIKEIGPRIVLVIKGEPILTDVTRRDLKGIGIEKTVDEVIETEGIAVGLNLWDKHVNVKLRKRMKNSDLIISKGMANFEAMSELNWKASAYLMRAKCAPVSNALKVRFDTNVIKLVGGKTS